MVDLYNYLLNYTIGNFLTIFNVKLFGPDPIFYGFKRFISYFTFVLKEANHNIQRGPILSNFFDNFPSLEIDIGNKKEAAQIMYLDMAVSMEKEKSLRLDIAALREFESKFPEEVGVWYVSRSVSEKQISIYCDNSITKTIVWDKNKADYEIIDEQFYLLLKLTIGTDEKSMDQLISPLWKITSGLKIIDNVTLELLEIYKGSLIAEIKVWMKDLIAKEEVKAAMETTKEMVVKAVSGGQVSHMEVQKSREEIKNLHWKAPNWKGKLNKRHPTKKLNSKEH